MERLRSLPALYRPGGAWLPQRELISRLGGSVAPRSSWDFITRRCPSSAHAAKAPSPPCCPGKLRHEGVSMLSLPAHSHVTARVASTWWHLPWGGFGTFPSGQSQPCHGPRLAQPACPCWHRSGASLGITLEDHCGDHPSSFPCCSFGGFMGSLTAKPDALVSWWCPQSCATHRVPSAHPTLPARIFRAPWIHSYSRRALFSSSLPGEQQLPLLPGPAEP